MKLYHVLVKRRHRVVVEREQAWFDVTPLLPGKRPDLKAHIESDRRGFVHLADRIRIHADELEEIPRQGCRVLPPYTNPDKVICVALNYMDHIRENPGRAVPEKPILFSKLTSAIIGHGDPILHPRATNELDYEGELAVVIGEKGKHLSEAEALDYVFGYSIMNDVSARDIQRTESHWVRAKGGDTFAPFGPAIVTADEIPDPQALSIKTFRNGQQVQDGTTADMIFGVRKLIAFASEMVTLLPGDIISTGTPAGVGVWRKPQTLLKPGDTIRIEIEGIGVLENPVKAEP